MVVDTEWVMIKNGLLEINESVLKWLMLQYVYDRENICVYINMYL